MTKIVRIIARLNTGGPAIHTILLSGGLNRAGYEDILVSGHVSESEGDMSYLAGWNNVQVRFIPELGVEISFWNDVKSFYKLYNMIRTEKPDIVHTHTAKAGGAGQGSGSFGGNPDKGPYIPWPYIRRVLQSA